MFNGTSPPRRDRSDELPEYYRLMIVRIVDELLSLSTSSASAVDRHRRSTSSSFRYIVTREIGDCCAANGGGGTASSSNEAAAVLAMSSKKKESLFLAKTRAIPSAFGTLDKMRRDLLWELDQLRELRLYGSLFMLGPSVVEISWLDARDRYCDTDGDEDDDGGGTGGLAAQEESLIVDEICHVLRSLLVNQRQLSENEGKEPCCYGTSVRITARITESYWHHTVYWLCEILRHICVEFKIVMKPPTIYGRFGQAAEMTLLKCVNSELRSTVLLNLRVHTYIIHWRFVTLRNRTTKGCSRCAYDVMEKIDRTVNCIIRQHTVGAIENIIISGRYVRLYRRAMRQDTNFSTVATTLCPIDHIDTTRNSNYARIERLFPFTIELDTFHFYNGCDDRSDRPPWYRPSETFYRYNAVRAIKHITHWVVGRLLQHDSHGVVRVMMNTDFFLSDRWFPLVMSLFGERCNFTIAHESMLYRRE